MAYGKRQYKKRCVENLQETPRLQEETGGTIESPVGQAFTESKARYRPYDVCRVRRVCPIHLRQGGI